MLSTRGCKPSTRWEFGLSGNGRKDVECDVMEQENAKRNKPAYGYWRSSGILEGSGHISKYWPGETEDNGEKPPSGYPVSRMIFEKSTS